ncbi:hypothetical protein PG993_015019 [Apiospora rasikravindrae]|uniref:Uncharacterized protein n=1 Tax=Apiospora rasikravindrae TaxID=990691 RepID=A0ABR1RPE0_9PEZI
MGPLILLSLVLGLVAQVMAAMEEDFIPTPVDLHAPLPEMVQAHDASPRDDDFAGMTKIKPATFFYTLDNGTEFSFTGEPYDFELAIKKHMPHYQIKSMDCSSGDSPPPGFTGKPFVGPRHEGDVGGVPVVADAEADAAAASPRLERRTKSNTPAPGVKDSVECLIRDLVADDTRDSLTTVRVENGFCSRIRCTGADASLFWCNYSHHPKRTTLSTFSVPVADINAKCGGNADDDGRGSVQGNAWNDYNHTMADARVYVGKCSCVLATHDCGPRAGYLKKGYTTDTS